MTTGIYCLYYETDDGQYYVGLSANIEGRYVDHCSALKRNAHHNKKLQDLYLLYQKLPTMVVLEEILDTSKLQAAEVYWINAFDSFYNGMNGTKGGDIYTFGEDTVQALYTKDTYIAILKGLADSPLYPRELAKSLGVDEGVLGAIRDGRSHCYLKLEYPEEYARMRARVYNRRIYDDTVYETIYKDMAYTDLTQKQIADKNRAPLSVVKDIAREETHTYLKDTLPEAYTAIQNKKLTHYPLFKDPEGNIHEIVNMAEFCKPRKLTSANMHKVASGERKQHKGWCLA